MGAETASQSEIGTYLLILSSIVLYLLFTLSRIKHMVYFSVLKD